MQDLLNDWVTQPAPPTAVHTPQALRKRVAQLVGPPDSPEQLMLRWLRMTFPRAR